MNKIGVHYGYWAKNWIVDLPFYISKAAELGFDILELSLARIIDLPCSEKNKIKEIAHRKNIELNYNFALLKKYDISSKDDSVRKEGIKYLQKNLEVVHKMGGNNFSGVTYGAWGNLIDNIEEKKYYLERSVNSTKEIIKKAEDLEICYNIEVVNRFEQFMINTCDEALEYVDKVDSPNLKIHLDTFHMNIEEDNIKNAIIRAGDKLGHLHIVENNRDLPGRGHLPWDEIFKAIKIIKYKGYIVFESFVQTGGEVGNALKIWRNQISSENLDEEIKKSLFFVKEKLK